MFFFCFFPGCNFITRIVVHKCFVLQQNDGAANFAQLDNDFAVGNNMLINTSGWAIGEPGLTNVTENNDGRPYLSIAKPSSLHIFIRCKNFCQSTNVTHIENLGHVFENVGMTDID